jgi:hypothetical protein
VIVAGIEEYCRLGESDGEGIGDHQAFVGMLVLHAHDGDITSLFWHFLPITTINMKSLCICQ